MEAWENTVLYRTSEWDHLRSASSGTACKFQNRRDSRDLEAAGALDVHEERVGLGDDLLELVSARVGLGGTVEEIDGESLGRYGQRKPGRIADETGGTHQRS